MSPLLISDFLENSRSALEPGLYGSANRVRRYATKEQKHPELIRDTHVYRLP